MADYTELVKELRYCVDGDKECAGCKRYGQMSCDVYLMEEAAYAIEHLNNLCMDLRGELGRTLDNYKLEKVLREELNAGLIEVFKRIPKWIPVTERLPEKDGAYLVCYGNGLITTDTFMTFEDGRTKWYDSGYDIGGVTNWMPLPEPPKEERT